MSFYIISLQTYNLEFYLNPQYESLNGIGLGGGSQFMWEQMFVGASSDIFPLKLFSCKLFIVFIDYQVICKFGDLKNLSASHIYSLKFLNLFLVEDIIHFLYNSSHCEQGDKSDMILNLNTSQQFTSCVILERCFILFCYV